MITHNLILLLLISCAKIHVKAFWHDDPEGVSNIVKRQEPNSENACTCIPYYQCTPNGTANEYGAGIIDFRLEAGAKCDHYLDVCCKVPIDGVILSTTTLAPDDGNQGNINTGNQGVGDNTGNQGTGNGNDNVTPKPTDPGPAGWVIVNNTLIDRPRMGCGYRNPEGVGFKIIGNTESETQFGEFPWVVAILKEQTIESTSTKVYQCGGSLIHQRVVLTAAHCVRGLEASKITVRAGEWDTRTANEPLPHQDRQVSIIVSHPEYDPDVLFHDYALLILNQSVTFASNVDVVCLPETLTENHDGSRCFASGWGKDRFGDNGRYSVILKRIEVPIVPHSRCQENLRRTDLGKYFKLHPSFICAGGEKDIDTCRGDGGSPLVCPLHNDPTRYTQVGIVAWGIKCGQEGIPGVYANVASGRTWIDRQLQRYNIDTASYRP